MPDTQHSDMAMLNPAYFPYWNKPEILWNDWDRQASQEGAENWTTPAGRGWY